MTLKVESITRGFLAIRLRMTIWWYIAIRLTGTLSLVPSSLERDEVHRIIFEELCKGQFLDASRRNLQEICSGLACRGAQGIVLGCTELCLILGEKDTPLPLFDTTALHAMAAVDFALAQSAMPQRAD